MAKKIICFIFTLLVCVSISLNAFATTDVEAYYEGDDDLLVLDGAGLLTQSELVALWSKLSSISQKYGAQVCVATVSTFEGSDIGYFTEYVYDEMGHGYGYDKDGVLLLVSQNPREYYVLSNGFAAEAITYDDIGYISDEFVPYLSDGDYVGAFNAYADECEYYLNGYINGFPFDSGETLLVSAIIGFVVALIIVSVWSRQLKSVSKQHNAREYVRSGSMRITQSSDLFLYSTVSKTARPKNTSSGSRSGSSRSGRGGSY